MSPQLNAITPSIASFRPERLSDEPPSRARPTHVLSQGYPPNGLLSAATLNLQPNFLPDPGEVTTVFEGISVLPAEVLRFEGIGFSSTEATTRLEGISFLPNDATLFSLFQVPVVRKQTKIRSAVIGAGDAIVHDLDELIAGKEDEATPTLYAYSNARRIVLSAYGKAKITGTVPTIVPKPLATTDDIGGIRLLWRLGARNVRLNFGADANRQTYLYYEAGQDHGVEPLDEDHLAARLAWLTGR